MEFGGDRGKCLENSIFYAGDLTGVGWQNRDLYTLVL